jgi:hypothetical protein
VVDQVKQPNARHRIQAQLDELIAGQRNVARVRRRAQDYESIDEEYDLARKVVECRSK